MPGKKPAVSLNIKNPEVHEAACQLAKMNGTSITAAVLDAVRAELSRQEKQLRGGNEVQRMQEYTRRVSAMPLLDPRPDDEIFGYGPGGLGD